ncbi:hypothetical protein DSO57_1035112 [Entomophthora muscae]|uniref:Uncharacterized protein n=1 Tax=Entomophthora muscae TaxID=34485 RepID=A0ACC2TYA0_9FUNG|nr:hypothetical protein DSO57_1035112 [Entomophthora muscae]
MGHLLHCSTNVKGGDRSRTKEYQHVMVESFREFLQSFAWGKLYGSKLRFNGEEDILSTKLLKYSLSCFLVVIRSAFWESFKYGIRKEEKFGCGGDLVGLNLGVVHV